MQTNFLFAAYLNSLTFSTIAIILEYILNKKKISLKNNYAQSLMQKKLLFAEYLIS